MHEIKKMMELMRLNSTHIPSKPIDDTSHQHLFGNVILKKKQHITRAKRVHKLHIKSIHRNSFEHIHNVFFR